MASGYELDLDLFAQETLELSGQTADEVDDSTTLGKEDQAKSESAADCENKQMVQGWESKVCVGCGCGALQPSPLCSTMDRRTGDYSDWSSNWCKHCASMARLRFVPLHGSLIGVEKWIRSDPRNASFFGVRMLAYYTLRKDPTVQRVSFQALECRVQILEQLMGWLRNPQGIPQPTGFGFGLIVDLCDAGKLENNPLLTGGVLTEMKYGGKIVLGIEMPVGSFAKERSCLPEALDAFKEQAVPGGPLQSVISRFDLRCESQEHIGAMNTMVKEYIDLAAARQSAGSVVCSSRVTFRGGSRLGSTHDV